MAELLLPKQLTRVRFPSPAPSSPSSQWLGRDVGDKPTTRPTTKTSPCGLKFPPHHVRQRAVGFRSRSPMGKGFGRPAASLVGQSVARFRALNAPMARMAFTAGAVEFVESPRCDSLWSPRCELMEKLLAEQSPLDIEVPRRYLDFLTAEKAWRISRGSPLRPVALTLPALGTADSPSDSPASPICATVRADEKTLPANSPS